MQIKKESWKLSKKIIIEQDSQHNVISKGQIHALVTRVHVCHNQRVLFINVRWYVFSSDLYAGV